MFRGSVLFMIKINFSISSNKTEAFQLKMHSHTLVDIIVNFEFLDHPMYFKKNNSIYLFIYISHTMHSKFKLVNLSAAKFVNCSLSIKNK